MNATVTLTERDPITLAVINNRLGEIVATMERLLFHSGYSTILRESYDGSAGITDVTGAAILSSGMSLHLPPYYYTVRAILNRYAVSDMHDGDSFIVNDPYLAGNLHVPDVAIVTPVFVDDVQDSAAESLIGFCVGMAHEPDVGGIVPGSSGAAAREIYHDGMLLPGVRYWTKAGVVSDIEAIVKRNSRTPELLAGDLRALVGCTHVGAERLRQLCAEYGRDTIVGSFGELQATSERRARAALRALPDGQVDVATTFDGAPLGLGDIPVKMRVTVRDGSIVFDTTGTAEQVPLPINIRPQATETAIMLSLVGFLDPTIPINDGTRRALELINPEGTLTHARWPSPVNNYAGVMGVIYELTLKALAHFKPDRAVGTAGFGLGAITIAYPGAKAQPTKVQYELLVTSFGGNASGDGTFSIANLSHLTPNTPIEILESEYPVQIDGFEIVPDTGGAGFNRGGMGFEKRYLLVEDAMVTVRFSLLTKSSTGLAAGWGARGGGEPSLGRTSIRGIDARERPLPEMATVALKAGETVIVRRPGGGGYDDPFKRPAERVLEDIFNGYVSVDGAQRDYGVVVDPVTLTVDDEATAEVRNGH
jgi:N-methylhydantoinase B